MSDTPLLFPDTLPFPIRIVSLLVNQGDSFSKNSPLFRYSYSTKVSQIRDINEEELVKTVLFADYDTPAEGSLSAWAISKGDIISKPGSKIALIAEPCNHEVQFEGMCALCGKDLTFQDYSGYNDSKRANVNMFHNSSGLAVSMNQAEAIEKKSTLALLSSRKLILVVDLDQTVIHTTVDPAVAEWKANPDDPHYEAVKDVHTFSLQDGSSSNFWYYVKVRPGLDSFLKHVSQLYELHIYTMATKSYAAAISKIIDPKGIYFGDRVLTRDESGNLEQKDLNRLFPVDTSLVVIIDDRGDVWKWSANLIKVVPYEFFVGTGDINSKFLPKRQDISAAGSTTGSMSDKTQSDEDLISLEQALVHVHDEYYEEYDYSKTRVAGVKRKRTSSTDSVNGGNSLKAESDRTVRVSESDWRKGIPDIKTIMPRMKSKVLEGVTILMSGTIPLGAKLNSVDVVIWARSFGANVVDTLAFDVTHLVAERSGTEKVHRAARKFPSVKIVRPAWLYKCLSSWERVDEAPYLLDVSPNSSWDVDSSSSSDFDPDELDEELENEIRQVLNEQNEQANDLAFV
ncbi:HAD-like domain-containing protein [Lipomyces oligophaga]|uniref:HAD-like domain-containing protein n=1 Tax=Lipomyces oligophaga TaxID=45792 RepID=UPI0034CE8272